MGIKNAMMNRPVRVVGFVIAVHSILYGIGISTGIGGFSKTLLFSRLGFPEVVIPFAASIILSGGFLCFAYVRNNPKTIRTGSLVCASAWMFAVFVYLLGGAWLVGLTIAMPWSFLAYYLAYAHSNRSEIMAYDQTRKAKVDTAMEDQL